MSTSIALTERTAKAAPSQPVAQAAWERVILLIVLGYEGLGAMLGGALLLAAPDGHLMDMPVGIMRGTFPDFLIPGLILFFLGILNVAAFFTVLRRTGSGWIFAGLAMSGLLIWFLVEIFILQELHWLHAMWGLPVVIGSLATLPMIPVRQETMRKALLMCGIISSFWYVAINIIVPMYYPGYSSFSGVVSELSAIGAPTRPLWVSLCTPYSLLVIAFAWGIWKTAGGNRRLYIVAVAFIVNGVIGFFWPPMHQREVLAIGGATVSDTLHIDFTIAWVVLVMLIIAFGAASLGKRFRLYSIGTLILLPVFGVLTGLGSSSLEANLPTPCIGVWERINIGLFMIWVIVFATMLLARQKRLASLTGAPLI